MKKTTLRMAIVSLLAAIMACAPTQALAQEKKKDKASTEKKAEPTGERPVPFNGKVAAIDKVAKTVKVGERVFQITSETKIMKSGKPATLDDGAVGEEVAGRYRKASDGKLNALTVRFGSKPEGEPKGEKKGKKKKNDSAG